MYDLVYRLNLFWIFNDGNIRKKAKFSPLLVIVRHLGYSADDGVAQSNAYANYVVTAFRLWNDACIGSNVAGGL